MKNILVVHTGGTFGMELGKTGNVQSKEEEYLSEIGKRVPELSQLAKVDVKVLFNFDSSDVKETEWTLLAQTIVNAWETYDGFVIVHGTDTMAYSACALSYFLPGLTKSVVLTGSQRPLSALRSDARSNIIDAVELATYGFPEVLICFDGLVHRGTRATKYSNEMLHAFRSPNMGPMAHFGVHFRIKNKKARQPIPPLARSRPYCDTRIETQVISLDTLPSQVLPQELLQSLVSSARGLVLRGFGSGNLPLRTSCWTQLCQMARDANVPVVIGSQCPSGVVSLAAYENGRQFKELGALSAFDMTLEATTLKLMVMLGRKVEKSHWQEFLATPLAGEVTKGDN